MMMLTKRKGQSSLRVHTNATSLARQLQVMSTHAKLEIPEPELTSFTKQPNNSVPFLSFFNGHLFI